MFWSTVSFKTLIKSSISSHLRQSRMISFLISVITPLDAIYVDTLYKMQHFGAKIYLEKVLNEHFKISGYNPKNHEYTKKIYIEDVAVSEKLYIFQDAESDITHIDSDAEYDEAVYLDADGENLIAFSFVIFIPDTIEFQEYKVRNLVDYYRYIGKKYDIQTYIL